MVPSGKHPRGCVDARTPGNATTRNPGLVTSIVGRTGPKEAHALRVFRIQNSAAPVKLHFCIFSVLAAPTTTFCPSQKRREPSSGTTDDGSLGLESRARLGASPPRQSTSQILTRSGGATQALNAYERRDHGQLRGPMDSKQTTAAKETKPTEDYIFRPWITDPKTGQKRYPKNGKVFKIPVSDLNKN